MLTLTVTLHNGQPPRVPLSATFDADGGTVGRAVTNRLVLDDAERTVSRLHVQIEWRDGRFLLIDRGSNPALVNGAPLDPGQEVAQGLAVGGVAGQHLIGQRQAIRRHHQRDHHLQAVRPAVPAVAAPGFWILFHLAFEVRARQVIEQDLEVGGKQVRPLLPQKNE